jgi:hypothetical protein
MSHPVDTLEYWVHDFSPTRDEIELLYTHVLGHGLPTDLEDLADQLIRIRIESLRASGGKGKGDVYRPNDRYEKGQTLLFPMLGDSAGTVQGVRPGNNPDYGAYDVIAVKLDGRSREFAAGLETGHRLIAPEIDVDADAIGPRFASIVAPGLATQLASDSEWVHYGDHWILKGLLPDIHVGHLNLAEAIIMITANPMSTADILPQLELETDAPLATQEFAVVLALSHDDRFRNVGALETPLWALATQLER